MLPHPLVFDIVRYRTYFGQVTPSGSIAVMQLTPNATYTINGNRVQQQILAMWAGWSTGGTNANNTIFIMAQESHAIAPYVSVV